MASCQQLSYRYLGSSGLRVSTLCLGTLTFGKNEDHTPGCDEETAHAMLDRFVELGGNFIDTADVYGFGMSESIIGRWLQKRPQLRSKIIIATKVYRPLNERADLNSRGLSRHHILQAIEQSLSRLNTDYIDLYQTHCWDKSTAVEETLQTLHSLVQAGKVHYIGVSNVTGWQVQKIIEKSRAMGITQIVSLQAQYNLLCRTTEWELVDVCRMEGLALLPWSPLKGGLLTGRITRGDSSLPPRFAWVEQDKARRVDQSHPSLSDYVSNEQYWDLLETMKAIASSHESTVSQVAIAWLLTRHCVSSVVIGARTVEQLEENLAAAQLKLSANEMELLDKKSSITLPYPYEMIRKRQITREEI